MKKYRDNEWRINAVKSLKTKSYENKTKSYENNPIIIELPETKQDLPENSYSNDSKIRPQMKDLIQGMAELQTRFK